MITFFYTNDDDGIWIKCECGWTKNLGQMPTWDDITKEANNHKANHAPRLRKDLLQTIGKALSRASGGKLGSKSFDCSIPILDAILDFLEHRVEDWTDGDGRTFCSSREDGYCNCPTDDQTKFLISTLRDRL